MRLRTAAAATGLALLGGAAQAATLEIKDAVARVVIVPEARPDIKVEILTRNPSLPLRVRTQGAKTIIDGDLNRRVKACQADAGKVSVVVSGVGDVGWADMPQVVVRMPMDAVVEAGGAVFGSVGRTTSLDLANAGCGDWTVANVKGRLRLNQAGSGDTWIGSVGQAVLRVAGSGDIAARNVAGKLEVDIAGSGDVSARSVSGPLDVRIAGSGDAKVAGGRATEMNVTIAGSGDVVFDGSADSLKARIAGSGDVRVKAVKGPVSRTIVGSGVVTIG